MAEHGVAEAAAGVEAACAAFLAAASPDQRGAAERFLLDFRQHPQPLPVCRHLLLHSSAGYAKLQALYTVRECLGALWNQLTPEVRAELQQLLLNQLAAGAAVERYVSEAAAQVLAVFAKHDLLRSEGAGGAGGAGGAADSLLHGAAQMLDEPSGVHAEPALRVLSALLNEFGAPSAGTVGGGLSWSMHARARTAFEERYLAALFRLGKNFLVRSHQQAAGGRALTLCASLLSTALSWEFGGIGEAAADGEPRPGLGASVVRPPRATAAAWSELLRTTDLLAAAVEMNTAQAAAGVRLSGGSSGLDGSSELMHAPQQLLVSLASVSRLVFEPFDETHIRHASLLLSTAAQLTATAPTSGAGGAAAIGAPVMGDAAFMNGCVILQRLVACSGAEALLKLPAESVEGMLRLLHTASLHALQTSIALQAAGDTDELNGVPVGAVVDGLDVLMEAWVSLLCGTISASSRPPSLTAAAWAVYEASVHARLHACSEEAAREAEDEVEEGCEDEDREHERMCALATLGRAKLPDAAALLIARLDGCTSQLRSYCELVSAQGAAAAERAGASAASLASLHEQCEALVRCAGHLLADDPAHGETLEPPPEAVLAGACSDADAVESVPVARLSAAVIELLRLQLTAISSHEAPPASSPLAAALSPLLGTSLLWFLRRFASTYLMPDEATCSVLSPAYLALYGTDTPGAASLLSLCVDAAAMYIVRWSSEAETGEEACQLLAALARLRAPRRGPAQMLSHLPSWHALARADPAALPNHSQRLLLEAMCRAAAANPDERARDATLRALIAPLPPRLAAVAASATLLRPDVCVEVRACCGALRGAALAASRDTAVPTAESIGGCLPHLLGMAPTYCPSAEPLLPILKVHRDLARTTAALLPMAIALALAKHCAELVATYAQHSPPPDPPPANATASAALVLSGGGGGKGGSKGGGGARAVAEAEEIIRYKQVKTLLQLLQYLAARDEEATTAESVADERAYTSVLCAALGGLLPCVTPSLLDFPKLCAAYFLLLGTYLETRPLAAVSMPPQLYSSVLSSIAFGLSHHDASICRGALEAAYEFARRASQHAGYASPTDELLKHLLGRIAADLLTSRLHPDVVDPAGGNALLALIVAQPSHWQALVGSLVGAQPTPQARERATAAFGALLTTNGVVANLTRPNRTRFRANLDSLLRAVGSGGLVLPTGT